MPSLLAWSFERMADFGTSRCITCPPPSLNVLAGIRSFIRHLTPPRTALEGKVVQIPDILNDPDYDLGALRQIAVRTLLGVPLLREGVSIGIIVLMRRTVRPFTDRQIELATTFADQAVIAIENVRLFDEIQ